MHGKMLMLVRVPASLLSAAPAGQISLKPFRVQVLQRLFLL